MQRHLLRSGLGGRLVTDVHNSLADSGSRSQRSSRIGELENNVEIFEVEPDRDGLLAERSQRVLAGSADLLDQAHEPVGV